MFVLRNLVNAILKSQNGKKKLMIQFLDICIGDDNGFYSTISKELAVD